MNPSVSVTVCWCVFVLEGQRLATEVRGCVGIKDGAARLGGVVTQSDVPPAAQDVALSARTPLCMMRPHTHTQTHTHTHTLTNVESGRDYCLNFFKRLWEWMSGRREIKLCVCLSPGQRGCFRLFQWKICNFTSFYNILMTWTVDKSWEN